MAAVVDRHNPPLALTAPGSAGHQRLAAATDHPLDRQSAKGHPGGHTPHTEGRAVRILAAAVGVTRWTM